MQRLCEYCGNSFKTDLPYKIYCSHVCSVRGPLSKRRYGGLHYKVLERDEFKCTKCGETKQLHVHHIDENVLHNEMSNLVTLCQSCHKHLHQYGSQNNHYKSVTREQIEYAISSTSTLDEASKILGVTRSTLRKKRNEYSLPQLPNARKGKENKHYIELSLKEIEMAYELEGTWVKAAKRLGVSEAFLRKRFKELKGLDTVRNRIYKDISKEQILQTYNECGNWAKTAEMLGVTRKTLRSKRIKYEIE